MTVKPLRVGVIGCGAMGQVHLELFAAMDGVEIVAVADIDGDRARDAAHTFGVPHSHTDGLAVIDHGLDLITICTLPGTHRDLAVAALERGAHVFCEKPMAANADEAADMVRAAERHDRLLIIGFNTRFLGATGSVRQFLSDGLLGDPVCARGHYFAQNLPWTGKHHIRAFSGGGALASATVHVVDLLLWLAGSPRPLTASASMAKTFPMKRGTGAPDGAARDHDVEDILFGHIRCEGFWFSVEGTWTYDRAAEHYSFDLYGTRGQAHLDPLELYTEVEGQPRRVRADAPTDPDWFGSFIPQLQAVVDAVRTGVVSDRLATGRQALVVQSVVDALYRSALAGAEVAVEIPSLGATMASTPA